ncbi:MAG TPA: BrnT family toxin [Acetobacteraceae bacterium]|nr:BrnT family toxin [Acetobacteraceae bacterium]
MEFERDRPKHLRNLATRGFGFDYASGVLEQATIEWPDKRRDYGEVRTCALGQVGPDVMVVVYTRRGSVTRIISARPANRKERQRWQLRE